MGVETSVALTAASHICRECLIGFSIVPRGLCDRCRKLRQLQREAEARAARHRAEEQRQRERREREARAAMRPAEEEQKDIRVEPVCISSSGLSLRGADLSGVTLENRREHGDIFRINGVERRAERMVVRNEGRLQNEERARARRPGEAQLNNLSGYSINWSVEDDTTSQKWIGVHVADKEGRSCTLGVRSAMTGAELYAQISRDAGISGFALYFGRKPLRRDSSLGDQGVRDRSTLLLVRKNIGGRS